MGRRFRNEQRAKIFVLGIFALVGIAMMACIALVTVRAVFLSPRPSGTVEPWVATGLAEMATYSAAQTAVPTGAPAEPGEEPAAPTPGPLPPAPAPGGLSGKIVFTCFIDSHDDLCLMNPDGSGYTRLTDNVATDWYAALSPDGRLISFSSKRSGNWDLFLLDIGTLDVQQMTEDFGEIYAPEISPDGTRIVFVTTRHGKQDLYVMNLDGTGAFRLTDHPAHDFDPTWSPDGMQVAFTSNRTGTSELYVVDVPNGPPLLAPNARPVTSGSNQQEGGRVDWSPDGRWLGFYAGDPGDKDIFLVAASCADLPQPCGPGDIVRLTNGGNNKAPSFSPDGQWVAFASQIEGIDNEIWIMRLDGSGLTQITFNNYADWQPRWGP